MAIQRLGAGPKPVLGSPHLAPGPELPCLQFSILLPKGLGMGPVPIDLSRQRPHRLPAANGPVAIASGAPPCPEAPGAGVGRLSGV